MQDEATGLVVRLGPFVTLPPLVAENHTGWMFFGYFHSALGFSFTLLTIAAVLTGTWLWLRRGVGLLDGRPGDDIEQTMERSGIAVFGRIESGFDEMVPRDVDRVHPIHGIRDRRSIG